MRREKEIVAIVLPLYSLLFVSILLRLLLAFTLLLFALLYYFDLDKVFVLFSIVISLHFLYLFLNFYSSEDYCFYMELIGYEIIDVYCPFCERTSELFVIDFNRVYNGRMMLYYYLYCCPFCDNVFV